MPVLQGSHKVAVDSMLFSESTVLITQLYQVTAEIKTISLFSVWTKKQLQWQTFIRHYLTLDCLVSKRIRQKTEMKSAPSGQFSWVKRIFLQSSYETEALDPVMSLLWLTRKPWLGSSPGTTRRSISEQSHRSKMPPWGLKHQPQHPSHISINSLQHSSHQIIWQMLVSLVVDLSQSFKQDTGADSLQELKFVIVLWTTGVQPL